MFLCDWRKIEDKFTEELQREEVECVIRKAFLSRLQILRESANWFCLGNNAV